MEKNLRILSFNSKLRKNLDFVQIVRILKL